MKKLSVTLLALCGTFSFVPGASAEDCKKVPTCESLGFTQNVAECSGAALKCPWDLSLAACKAVELEAPLPFIYGDGLISKKVLANKKPVGVVFDETNKLAIALSDVEKDGTAGFETMYWSDTYCDIPNLANCQYDANDEAVDSCGADGRANTDAILAAKDSCGIAYAAKAVNDYTPSDCSADFCKKNQWFLPSMGELANVYKNRAEIDASLALLKDNTTVAVSSRYLWSSTEYDETKAWRFRMASGSRINGNKDQYEFVRPVVYYGEDKAQPVTCAVGSILGNDQLCYSPDTGMPDGVKAIGVVFDTTKQLAVSLTTVTPAVKWSEKTCDVPELQNCTSINCGTGGWENTNAMGTAGYSDACSDMNPLANLAAANYTAPGCDKVFCSQGQWHLPSISELETIIDIVAVKGNPIDKGLAAAGGVLFFVTSYWSSTEHSASSAWATGINTNGAGMPKTMSAFVRPVLYYGPDDVCIVANCKTCKDRNMGSCAVCNSGYTASPLAGVCLKN